MGVREGKKLKAVLRFRVNDCENVEGVRAEESRMSGLRNRAKEKHIV